MFSDLDQTLKTWLSEQLPKQNGNPVAISFATPDEQFPPADVTPPLINLFLYDLRENWDLRSNEWTVERTVDGLSSRRPPVRVDCSYLITAWSKATSAEDRAREEHWMLGAAAQILLRYRRLPPELLQGRLDAQQPPRLPAVPLGAGHVQSAGELWQALGGKPRATLHYTVTIALEPWDAVDLGKPVADHVLQLRQIPPAAAA